MSTYITRDRASMDKKQIQSELLEKRKKALLKKYKAKKSKHK